MTDQASMNLRDCPPPFVAQAHSSSPRQCMVVAATQRIRQGYDQTEYTTLRLRTLDAEVIRDRGLLDAWKD
jgi:hypothetical protein